MVKKLRGTDLCLWKITCQRKLMVTVTSCLLLTAVLSALSLSHAGMPQALLSRVARTQWNVMQEWVTHLKLESYWPKVTKPSVPMQLRLSGESAQRPFCQGKLESHWPDVALSLTRCSSGISLTRRSSEVFLSVAKTFWRKCKTADTKAAKFLPTKCSK